MSSGGDCADTVFRQCDHAGATDNTGLRQGILAIAEDEFMRVSRFSSVLFLLMALPSYAQTDLSARVMIVHSYEVDHVCGHPQQLGVIEALAAHGWKRARMT